MGNKYIDTRRIHYLITYGIAASLTFVLAYTIFKRTHRYIGQYADVYERSMEIDGNYFNNIHDKIAELINKERIRNNSRHYSEYPHPPGSKRNRILALEMARQWKKFGFDKTEIFKYRVLLSFPMQPAEIQLKNNLKVVKQLFITNEPAFGESEKKGKPVYPFHPYSISGNVTGEVVLVNYGEDEDYTELKKMKVKLNNKIFIIRYGSPKSRSSFVKRAYDHGAIGVIFYSDPFDYSYPGEEYPNGWMLNKYGVQRGSIYALRGDALSIGYPSKEHYYRDKSSSYKYLVNIPSQPISAQTAAEIFSFMEDDSVTLPLRFKGGLNLTYVLQSGKARQISLNVKNKLGDRDTYVVCGSLFGGEEPDRYIIIGNHRDAWTYGAADAVSGSAVMTEIVRVLGKSKVNLRYALRRSIMVCSWGAEEAGILGSTEWADENANFLSKKVVAYLNVDMAVEGNFTVQIKSLDHMVDSIFEASKRIKCACDRNLSLFQDMCHKHALLLHKTEDLVRPDYKPPGMSSDGKSFVERHGISVSDYRYTFNALDFPRLRAQNGNYHTLYDSFDWMNGFVDPTFEHHAVLGRLWLRHALTLSDSVIIPFDLEAYARQVHRIFMSFGSKYKTTLGRHNVSLMFAKKRVKSLVLQASQFHETIKNKKEKLSFSHIRAINDRIMHFEKHFILNSEVGNQKLNHIIYAKREHFYGLIYAITQNPGDDWDNVRKEITLFVWCVDMATRSLDLTELGLEQK